MNCKLFVFNFVFSVGAIVGASLWLYYDDYFTLGGSYGFYWFTAVFSLLVGIVGYAYHLVPNIRNRIPISHLSENVRFYMMFVLAIVMWLFWLSSSASVASYLKDCLYIKNGLRSRGFDDNLDFGFVMYNKRHTCIGEAVTTAFGFANFIVWSVIFYIVGCKIYKIICVVKEPELEAQAVQRVQELQGQVVTSQNIEVVSSTN